MMEKFIVEPKGEEAKGALKFYQIWEEKKNENENI